MQRANDARRDGAQAEQHGQAKQHPPLGQLELQEV